MLVIIKRVEKTFEFVQIFSNIPFRSYPLTSFWEAELALGALAARGIGWRLLHDSSTLLRSPPCGAWLVAGLCSADIPVVAVD